MYDLIKRDFMDQLLINSKKDKGLYDVFFKVKELLSEYQISFEFEFQIEIIIEEIFVNIVKHAYNDEEGIIEINFEVLEDPLRIHIVFIDNGPMFNPLEFENSNLSDDIDEREIGKLGIYIVKEYADDINYNYKNNQNVLSIIKSIH